MDRASAQTAQWAYWYGYYPATGRSILAGSFDKSNQNYKGINHVESLSTLIQSPPFSKLAITLGGLIAIALFWWWRTGSLYAPLDRLWHLVAGKADVHDSVVKALLQESRDIEKFNYTYRLKVETVAAIHKLDKWRRTHEIGMSQLQKIRFWIDVNSPELVRQPSRYHIWVCWLLAFLISLSMFTISQFAASHDAYLRMRESTVWFKTDAVIVKAPLDGWSFDAEKCATDKTGITQLTGFNASETDALCKALKGDALKQLVKQSVKSQRWLGIAGTLITAAMVTIILLSASSAAAALRLIKRLHSSAAADGDTGKQAAPVESTKRRPERSKSRSKTKPGDTTAEDQSGPKT